VTRTDEAAPIRTVAAVLRDARGRVLLVRKRGTRVFIQPGGKREAGESSLDTLARELGEELGIGFDPAAALRLGEFEDAAVHEPGRRVRAEVFLVTSADLPQAGAEIEALAWVDPGATGDVPIAPLSSRWILPAVARHAAAEALPGACVAGASVDPQDAKAP
jgi:8-oxo-dGTP diphosphatase